MGPTRSQSIASDPLDRLLRQFDPDPEEAGERYLRLREKLVSYFEIERLARAEELADETLDRLARRVSQGEEIHKLSAYALGVARLVALETRQREAESARKLREFARISGGANEAREPGLQCLDCCLEKLPAESRALILAYYREDRGARIEQRKKMAEQFGLNAAALRNRALRLRANLEVCLKRCLRGAL
jgi:DNA-directed RNA polymerase specialized sigma24 family protein